MKLKMLVGVGGDSFTRAPVTGVHQCEFTSNCSLRCNYCPNPLFGKPGYRTKLDMSEAHFAATLDLVRHFVRRGTQGPELNIAGVGESTMLPHFVDWVHRSRAALGPDRKLYFATNGLHMTREMAKAIASAKPRVHVSLHAGLRRCQPAIAALREFDLFDGASSDPAVVSISWAGQVDWPSDPSYRPGCHWLRLGRVFVRADGNIAACCFDARDAGIIGNVLTSVVDNLVTHPYKLCRTCEHVIGLDGFDQKKACRPDEVAEEGVAT